MRKHSRVCIQRDFCPLCFRGGACTDHVPLDSPRINEEQRECSRAFLGLPLLDLEMPGERCPYYSSSCRLICLVCGTPMAFACEPEFESALDLVEKFEEEALEMRTEVLEGGAGLGGGLGRSLGEKMLADLERRFISRLKRMGMAWHPRWERPVHSRCLKKSQTCGCLVPVGLPVCPEHKRPVASAAPSPPRKGRASSSAGEIKKAPSPKKQQPVVMIRVNSKKPVSMVKATWLLNSSSTPTSTVTVHPPPAPSATFKKVFVLPKPPIPKPNPKLEAAAKGTGKLDGWSGKAAVGGGGGLSLKKDSKKAFNLARHEREFDMFQHGYLRKNGVDMYRFPDGTEVQVYSTVNVLTDDGQLKASIASAGGEQQEGSRKDVEEGPAAKPAKPAAIHKPPPKKANPKLEAAAKGSAKLDSLFRKVS